MESRQKEGTGVQAEKGGWDTERGMTFRSERTVTDLGGLEGDNHVSGRSKHGKVSSNGGRERDLEPVIWGSIWEGGSKHLADRHVGSNVGENGDDDHEPVDTWYGSHLVGTSSHGETEESLWNTGIIKGSNEDELTNEKHEKTVIDFRKSGLGLSHKLLLLGFDFVTVHVVSLLGSKWVALAIVLSSVGSWVVVLTLVGGDAHEKSSSADGDDAHIETGGEADQEKTGNKDLDS